MRWESPLSWILTAAVMDTDSDRKVTGNRARTPADAVCGPMGKRDAMAWRRKRKESGGCLDTVGAGCEVVSCLSLTLVMAVGVVGMTIVSKRRG